MEGLTDPHRPGKLETIGDWVDETQDLEWSYVAWMELLRRKITGGQPHPLTRSEEPTRPAVRVCLVLVAGRGAEQRGSRACDSCAATSSNERLG